jgi:hypothetical protein
VPAGSHHSTCSAGRAARTTHGGAEGRR